MAWWISVIYLAGAVALSFVLRPRPPKMNQSAPKPAGIDEFDFPTATPGRPIPVVFGTRWVSGPNVVWYGDLKTTPIVETTCGSGKK